MILFRNVRWRNLLSTGNYFTEIKLDDKTNTLVVGENGSGKSTMLDALCFGLFGKPFRNINKPQLLNSINQKDCLVEVEFDTGNKSYKIVRGIKPNKFEIYCDNNLINQEAAARDYQEFLEKFILKLNYKSFTQIVILGSASFTPFMQLSATDRRAIIEDLLDIQIFSTMGGLVKERLSTNKEGMSTKKHEIELTQQKYDMQKKHIDEMKQNNEDKVNEYVNEISCHSDTVSDLLSNVATLTAETEELQLVVASKIDTETKVKKITKLESQIETNLSKFQKDISFFQSHDDCPTCRQAIANSFKEEELGKLSTKVDECKHGLTELEKKLLEEQNKLNAINETQKLINQKQVEIATANTTITETNKMIARLQKLIEELKNSKVVTDLEEQRLKELKDSLSLLKEDLKLLIEEKSYYDVASALLKDSGIKTKIVKQYLPVINKLVNKYLASLDFFVNFNLDESFKETIKSRHRDEFSYNNFSEGEKQRIDMALMLTWRAVAKLKNSSNTNLLILDETFDSSLDANGTEELMKILHMLEGVNLFVISHKGDILQDKFANVIRFVKEKNFSRIVK
jgi:DNA repair exonuclease SbcCD ATPase subunit